MDFIIIIMFIIIVLTLMIMAYIPYDLHILAKKAGFSKFSLRFLILKFQKIPVKFLFTQYEKIVDNSIDIDFDKFKLFWSKNPDNFQSLINNIIKARKYNVKISLDDLYDFNLQENDSERFFTLLKKAEEQNLNLKQEKIIELLNSETDIIEYFKIAETAKEIQLDIFKFRVEQNDFVEIKQFIKNSLQAESMGIIADKRLFSEDNLTWNQRNILLTGLLKIKQNHIDLSNEELFEIHNSGINTYDFLRSLEIIKKNKAINISKKEIKDHYLKGGDSYKIISGFEYAELNNVKISIEDLMVLDLNKEADFKNALEQAVIPFDLDVVPAINILLEDGIQVSPKLSVSVRKKINTSDISDEKTLFYKINETVGDDIMKFSSYSELLKKLKTISETTLSFLKKEKNEAFHKSYELLKIKIKDIELKADKLADIKNIQAKEKESEIKTEHLKAKKKFDEEMSKALKKGKISYKDYQKEKYIFNTDVEDDLPYHKSDK